MVYVLCSKLPAVFPAATYTDLLSRLPLFLQNKNCKYHYWQDKLLNLLGNLLLLEGLSKLGYTHMTLDRMEYNTNGRPFIAGCYENIDFNISHSGEYVICAISNTNKVGIDIEAVKPVAFSEFRHVMTDAEWHAIETAEDPLKSFFDYWTIKESVIKADGRGMSIDLTAIDIKEEEAVCEDKTWYLHSLDIDDHYAGYLATDVADTCVDTDFIEYYNL